ncbi:hypothetical protein MMIC_P0953 [Mariprofundus micogutta]|uniref:Uncharacterized protein n=1 Tax=Mariprofundus micogutta TaxID=1921010 RepID=A0A1L8CM55_9PROT|nr:hypothetical protein [Mariprofundus micogutta]GAV19992.1 hypothetical protein MMIC_P0953 [Mariprofundus micogutta]
MQSAYLPAQELSIHRHCMQQLIHQSLIFDQENCHGFLIGSGQLIRSNSRTAQSVDPAALLGVYLRSNEQGKIAPARPSSLQQQFIKATGREPDCYMVLQCGNKGRTDALLFSDIELSQPLELEMLEDGVCTPSLAKARV